MRACYSQELIIYNHLYNYDDDDEDNDDANIYR